MTLFDSLFHGRPAPSETHVEAPSPIGSILEMAYKMRELGAEMETNWTKTVLEYDAIAGAIHEEFRGNSVNMLETASLYGSKTQINENVHPQITLGFNYASWHREGDKFSISNFGGSKYGFRVSLRSGDSREDFKPDERNFTQKAQLRLSGTVEWDHTPDCLLFIWDLARDVSKESLHEYVDVTFFTTVVEPKDQIGTNKIKELRLMVKCAGRNEDLEKVFDPKKVDKQNTDDYWYREFTKRYGHMIASVEGTDYDTDSEHRYYPNTTIVFKSEFVTKLLPELLQLGQEEIQSAYAKGAKSALEDPLVQAIRKQDQGKIDTIVSDLRAKYKAQVDRKTKDASMDASGL